MTLPPNKFYKFCPRCGAQLVLRAGPEHPLLTCTGCGFVLYHNPRAAVGAIVRNERGEVLLVRRAIEPRKGTWDIPGGFVDDGEEATDAVIREMREETGMTFTPTRAFGNYHDWYDAQGLRVSVMILYYEGRAAGTPRPADDVAEVGWFALDALPSDLAFHHVRRAFEDLRRGT